MSNSVDILIKADDQASKALRNVGQTIDASVGKFQQAGKKAKAATEIIGAFANVTGSTELAGLAGGLASVTEKMQGFAEQAKNGGASSFAFKAGIAGLVGTIAFGLGKALADIIWKTASFEKSMELANKQAASLDKAVGELQSRLIANQKEDIELIQDPAEKQAAYQALIADLNKNIEGVSKNVEHSRKQVMKWAEAWQITGDRKQYAKDAEEQLQKDLDRLEALKRERDEITRNTSERTKNIEAIKAANAAKERSKAFVEDLRREVQYLQASRAEQIAMDAAKNATANDQGEVQRLMAERDAILAKKEAEKQAEQERKKADDEKQRERERIKQEREREKQALEDLKKSERETLDLMRIELEQGKEAARIKEFMNKGVDEKTAKEFAAEEARLEKLKEDKNKKVQASAPQKLTATETRLLTRGSSEDQSLRLQQQISLGINLVANAAKSTAAEAAKQTGHLEKIQKNTTSGVVMVKPA